MKITLIEAAQTGQLEEVQRLLAIGEDLYACDEAGYTAAHYAVMAGHIEVLEALCETRIVAFNDGRQETQGPDALLILQNYARMTPLALALTAYNPADDTNLEMIEYLLDKGSELMLASCQDKAIDDPEANQLGSDESWGATKLCSYAIRHPLCLAFAFGNIDIATAFLDRIEQISPNLDSTNNFFIHQALYMACLYQREDLVHLLFDRCNLPANLPLHIYVGQPPTTPLQVVEMQQPPKQALLSLLQARLDRAETKTFTPYASGTNHTFMCRDVMNLIWGNLLTEPKTLGQFLFVSRQMSQWISEFLEQYSITTSLDENKEYYAVTSSKHMVNGFDQPGCVRDVIPTWGAYGNYSPDQARAIKTKEIKQAIEKLTTCWVFTEKDDAIHYATTSLYNEGDFQWEGVAPLVLACTVSPSIKALSQNCTIDSRELRFAEVKKENLNFLRVEVVNHDNVDLELGHDSPKCTMM